MQLTAVKQINLKKSNGYESGGIRRIKVPLLSRLYVWSVIFEPLLFFVIFERTVSGVGGNVARFLQLVVLICLVFKLLAILLKSTDIRIVDFSSPLFINYGVYLFLALLSGLVGFLSGAYDLPAPYIYGTERFSFSQSLNSSEIRPFFEYIIALYYFGYFAILPKYLLKTKDSIRYYLSTFKVVFICSFVIGIIDFGFSIAGIALVPRHIADWVDVGVRFHGLAGEPRDGFIYLFLGLAMLHLYAYLKGQLLSKWWVVAIIIAAVLTQSASGLLGIVFFLGLYSIYTVGRLTLRRVGQLLFLMMITILLIYIAVVNSERIVIYVESASDVWSILEEGQKLPYLMHVQATNIYPLYDLTVKLRELNILPILIGSGFGSSSVINNIYYDSAFEMYNPNSQFVRTIFESGVIGMLFLILSFAFPVKYLTKHISKNKQHEFILLTLLLLGCFFGHRSAASFIYLGIFIATFRIYQGTDQYGIDSANIHDGSGMSIRKKSR